VRRDIVAKQFGLGKGLSALIPEPESAGTGRSGIAAETGELVLRLPLDKLRPNPDQPRKSFPERTLEELADSLRQHGLIQPLLVEEAKDGLYTIIAGERRYRAAERAGLSEVPVIVRSLGHERRLEIAIIENVQREDLNPIEEAEAYRSLMELGNRSQEEVADIVGKNRSTVANALRLLRLPPPMIEAVRGGELSPGHARAVLAVFDPDKQTRLFKKIIDEGLSVRQAEALAQDYNGRSTHGARKQRASEDGTKRLDPELREIEERLIRFFGTKVAVKGDISRGTISIEYFSMEDLERILEVLSSEDRD
jgi:ParB family chromosome partitioning protein